MLKLNLCSVVLHLQALFAVAFSHDMCECRYLFTEQPSNDHLCNPYPTGRLVTRCVVEYSTAEGAPLSIEWRAIDSSNRPPQSVLNAGTSQDSTSTSVGSRLTLQLPVATPQNYEGYRYFCRVKFSNGTTLKESQAFYLFPRSVFLDNVLNYPGCNVTDVLSTKFHECIDPLLRQQPVITTAPPTTPPPPPPPTTTVPEASTTLYTDPPTTEDSQTTSPPTKPRPPTTSSLPPTRPSAKPQTKPPLPPAANPPATTNPPVAADLTYEEQILLYSAIAAAVVLVVVVVILLLCLCLWNGLCQQTKTLA